MENFTKVCEDAKKRLGRQLQDDEIQFLRWVYARHQEEQAKPTSSMNYRLK